MNTFVQQMDDNEIEVGKIIDLHSSLFNIGVD